MSTPRFEVDDTFLLKKYPGKGGWTYTDIPAIQPDKNNPFGWVQVSGFIDDHEIKQHKLMPNGNNGLFLSIKAAIRKKIKKQAGDYVRVRLNIDNSTIDIPDEIMACFEMEASNVWQNFLAFSESEKKAYIDWIYAANKDQTRVQRIDTMLQRVKNKLRFHD